MNEPTCCEGEWREVKQLMQESLDQALRYAVESRMCPKCLIKLGAALAGEVPWPKLEATE